MTGWSWAWIGLIALLVGFEVFTIIRRGEGDTLSENVWKLREWLKGKGYGGKMGWALLVWALIGFFGWVTLHFVFPGAV